MSIYISIISHGHESMIIENSELLSINRLENVKLIIKDNTPSAALAAHCKNENIIYLRSDKKYGFGENNNHIFKHCKTLGIKNSDWFFIVNPDVSITVSEFKRLIFELKNHKSGIFAPHLYKDFSFEKDELSLRKFPNIKSLVKLFIKKPVCEPYNMDEMKNGEIVNWASGAFLIFNAELYESLNGFDERYFMYYEDVDICYRARYKFNCKVIFLKNISAVHAGAYQNRKVLSPHFRWYLISLFTFLLSKHRKTS
ncbi:glycosyltransferase [Motilimonas pumila]|uniref:Glycosyltransferase n=1 Tax=Motilimonas pumila TaxID=2303987 RepID=A0A418YJ28_9GAMM|nr:glycosyltransferase [Motilimonas pumila]RJG50617.1 glycosyltransferase [Motilimonas pumila]